MNRVLQIPTQVVKQKCLSEGPERHFFLILLLKVIRLGFEPKTHSLEGCCSIQLSYRTEPCCFSESLGATIWEADALVAEPRFRKWVQR